MMSMKAFRQPAEKAPIIIAWVGTEETKRQRKTVDNKEKKQVADKKAAEKVKKR